MRRKPIVACVVAIAVLIFGTFLFIVRSPPAPAITVRYIERGDGIIATFGVTNRGSGSYSVSSPIRLEVQNGLVWEVCDDGIGILGPGTLGSHAGGLQYCYLNKLAEARKFRVVMDFHRELRGLDSFFRRLQLLVTKGDKRWSLNPFDKNVVYSKPVVIASDEFAAPELLFNAPTRVPFPRLSDEPRPGASFLVPPVQTKRPQS
jgi:hypothetical protein